jgi:hypothetical protein
MHLLWIHTFFKGYILGPKIVGALQGFINSFHGYFGVILTQNHSQFCFISDLLYLTLKVSRTKIQKLGSLPNDKGKSQNLTEKKTWLLVASK